MYSKTFFMVGMPESGKTTYLVSLCRLLILGDVDTLLKLEAAALPEGLDEINSLIEKFGECRIIERTPDNTHYDIEIPLIDKEKNIIKLVIPDASGEYFRDLVQDRRLKIEIYDKLCASDEILFFINKNTMSEEKRFSVDEKSTVELLEANPPSEIKNNTNSTLKKKRANQSEMTELLQNIVYLMDKKIKVKFIVSAWDVVENKYAQKKITPDEYVKKELPLFYQYIQTNKEKIESEFFGVSAQGFDYSETNKKDILLGKKRFELIKVISIDGKQSNDLTRLLYE